MDNDNKIEQVPATTLFLDEQAITEQFAPQTYSLHDEFANSRKNKRIYIYLITLIFIVVSIVASYLITIYVENKNKQIALNIKAFDDINLTEALEKAKNAQQEINLVKQELNRANKEYESRLERLKKEKVKEIKVIEKQNLSEAQKRKLISQLEEKDRQRRMKLESRFNKIRQKSSKELNSLQNKVKESQGQLKRLAKSEEILKEKAKLLKGKIAEQQELYKLKLEARNKKIVELQREVNKLSNSFSEIKAQMAETTKQNKSFLESFKSGKNKKVFDLEKEISQLKKFNDTLKKIHSKKIARLEKSLKGVNQNQLKEIVVKNQRELKVLIDKNKKIISDLNYQKSLLSKYKRAFGYFSRKKREHGAILESKNVDEISVIINANYPVKVGDKAMVFSDSDKYLATIEFFKKGNALYAKIIKQSGKKKVRPFDKILIKLD